MNQHFRKIAGGICIVALSAHLSGCAVLENPELAALTGGGAGALIGGQIGGTRGAVFGGLAGGALGYIISKNYISSEAQKRSAIAAGKRASSRSTVKNSDARYVAVTVPKKEGKGKDVMVYDKEKKRLASERAYIPEEGKKYSSGKVIQVGGRSALVANSFVGV